MQSMLLSAVLFGGAHAQINIACIAPLQQLQTSCCTSGQSCPPTECSTECAPRFLDFLDTYDTECDSMIQQFGLGDLRGMCEATMAAGGETDTPADCGTGRAMGLAMACAYVDPTDFCSSPCYQQLDPFARECADVVPSEVMGMIGSALGMAVSCDEAAAAGGAGAGCSVMTLPLLCSGDLPTGEDPDDLCNDPCISGLLACAVKETTSICLSRCFPGLEMRVCPGQPDRAEPDGPGGHRGHERPWPNLRRPDGRRLDLRECRPKGTWKFMHHAETPLPHERVMASVTLRSSSRVASSARISTRSWPAATSIRCAR